MGMFLWSLSGGSCGPKKPACASCSIPFLPAVLNCLSTPLSMLFVAVCSWPSCFSFLRCVVAAVVTCAVCNEVAAGARCCKFVDIGSCALFAAALMVSRFDRLDVAARFWSW